MKAQNEKQIARLKEESERLRSQFEEMKYTGEAKLSRYILVTANTSMSYNVYLFERASSNDGCMWYVTSSF